METILLVHGALGDGEQLAPLARLLEDAFAVHMIELEGHGSTPMSADAYDLARFRTNVRDAMKARGVEHATIFGYSMGGYVALTLAEESPEIVTRVITLATKLAWTPESAARETGRLDPEIMRHKVPKFAEALERRHAGAGGWERVLSRTAALMTELGARPPLDAFLRASIACPVLLMVGDRDNVVSIDETVAATRDFAHGELAVIPEAHHPFEQVPVPLVAALVRDFMTRTHA